jgi:hypothetical protein
VNKARETKTGIITEDDLLEMIRTRPGDEETSNKQSSSAKLKRKSSSTVKKTTEPDPIIIPKTSIDQSDLLCKHLFNR